MPPKRKRYPTLPPMQHLDKFRKYLKEPKQRKCVEGIHCGFRLINQVPLYRIDTMENIEL